MTAALTRAHAAALAALGVLIALCTIAVGTTLVMRSQARDELDDKRAAFTRFVRLPAGAGGGAAARVGQAPAAAFIDAPTQGQAGAQLETYLARLAREQGAAVMSSGVEGERKGEPDAIRVQATIETTLRPMQVLLHRLETGTPYVVVESLSVQPSASGQRAAAEDGPLRVVVVLRGLWRRGTA